MVLEMTGARVLAPHVGTSAIVWTSLIGVVLAFLAVGAWLGGIFADKKLSRQGLGLILGCAGAGSALPAFCHTAIGAGISANVGNLYVAAILAAICIFALPATFFGMISPYAIRLRIASVDTAGRTVGRLYALSTAGSILGTFLGGFILISWFSSTSILWSVAICMLALSIINNPKSPWLRLILLAVCAFLAWQDHAYAAKLAQRSERTLIESPYNSILVWRANDFRHNGDEVVLMATDPGYSQSGMLKDDPAELYFNYTRFYGLGPALVPDAKKILMLGGGGYSVPKWLLSDKNGLAHGKPELLRVVEIDPAMTAAAREYFGLEDNPGMEILHEDARSFLNRQNEEYDLVFMDVFNSHYSIPFQMGTREAIQRLRKAVKKDGAVLINIISAITGEDGRLFRSIWKNLKEEFPNVRVYCVGEPDRPGNVQNLMVVAMNGDWPENPAQVVNLSMSPDYGELEKMQRRLYRGEIPDDTPPLEDDFAPVERYTLMLPRH